MLAHLKTVLSNHYATTLSKEPQALIRLMESPKAGGHGHVALPVFAWAKEFKKAPPVLAQELAVKLSADKPTGLLSAEPLSGFVNFTFDAKFVQDMLAADILGGRGHVGYSKVGAGKKLV